MFMSLEGHKKIDYFYEFMSRWGICRVSALLQMINVRITWGSINA